MSKAIIELYVDAEDLVKQCDILLENGYTYLIIKREKGYITEDSNGFYLGTKYFIEAHIGDTE